MDVVSRQQVDVLALDVCIHTVQCHLRQLGYHMYFYSTSHLPSFRFPHSKKVISPALSSRHLLPSQSWHIHNPHGPHASRASPPGFPFKPLSQLSFIDIFSPLVRPLGYNPQHILCHDIRHYPTRPRPSNRAENKPSTRLHMFQDVLKERTWRIDMFQDLEQ